MVVISKNAYEELMRRNLELTHLKFAYLDKKVTAFDFIEELLVRRRLSMDELKLYFLFLQEWLTPRTEKTMEVFYSQKELVRKLGDHSREILEVRKKMREQMKLTENGSAVIQRRIRELRFLSTHQNDLLRLFNSLLEKKLIVKREHSIEREFAPELFITIPEKPKRTTWNTMTFQPAIEYTLVPGEKPGEIIEVPCGLVIKPSLHGVFPMALPEIREVLWTFLLSDLGWSLQCRSPEDLWPRQQRLMNILSHFSFESEEFLYLSKEDDIKRHLSFLERMRDGGAEKMVKFLDWQQQRMEEVTKEMANKPLDEQNRAWLKLIQELDHAYDKQFPDDPVIDGKHRVFGFYDNTFLSMNGVPEDTAEDLLRNGPKQEGPK